MKTEVLTHNTLQGLMLIVARLTLLIFAVSCLPQNAKGVSPVLSGADPPPSSLAWSPTNSTQILVTAFDDVSWKSQVYIFDIETKDKVVVTGATLGDVRGISWSPDGEKIVIARFPNTADDETGLWLWDISSRRSEYVGEVGDTAAWSPTGEHIVVYRRPAGLYLLDIRTKQERLIFSNDQPHYVFGISWSPDAKKIVFSAGDFVASDLYILELETNLITQISSYGNNDYPAWSPDGGLIAYSKHFYSETEQKDVSSLHLTNVSGSCDIEIPNSTSALSPTWSPDGKQLAVLVARNIYIIDLEIVFGRDVGRGVCK